MNNIKEIKNNREDFDRFVSMRDVNYYYNMLLDISKLHTHLIAERIIHEDTDVDKNVDTVDIDVYYKDGVDKFFTRQFGKITPTIRYIVNHTENIDDKTRFVSKRIINYILT